MKTTTLRRIFAGLSLTFALASSQAQTSFIDYDYMGNDDQLDFDEAQNLEGRKIVCDKMGGIYVAGTGLSDAEGNDMILLKYTWNGSSFSLVWAYKYNGPVDGEDTCTGLVLDQYEVPYIAGSSEGDGTGVDLAVVAVNPVNGAILWAGDGAARYNSSGSQDDFAYDLAIDKAESPNLIVCGKTGTGSGDQGLVAVFESASGSMKSGWPELYGTSGVDERFFGVAVDDALVVYACGHKTTESNGTDILVVRFTGGGSQTHATSTDGAAHLDDEARDIAVGDDAVYLAGFISASGPSKRFAVAAYDDDDLSSGEWGGGPVIYGSHSEGKALLYGDGQIYATGTLFSNPYQLLTVNLSQTGPTRKTGSPMATAMGFACCHLGKALATTSRWQYRKRGRTSTSQGWETGI